MKKIPLFSYFFAIILSTYPLISFADTPTNVSSVTFTNNTSNELKIEPTLTTTDDAFKQTKDWDGGPQTIAPYQTKQILWFSRSTDVKNNQHYLFNVYVKSQNDQDEPVVFSFDEQGKAVGSDLTISLKSPEQEKKTILKKDGLEQYSSHFWKNDYTIYARSWLPSSQSYNNFHIVIDQPTDNNFTTSSNNQISVLTYNVQMMPFYAGVVDNLNQPKERVKLIPPQITKFDVVILEELFDHDLRETIVKELQPYYPFHTKVVDDTNAKILTGGVMIFSKWPITTEKQIVYKEGASWDYFAAKGAIYAAINKDKKMYHVIGTHLQAGNDPDEKTVKQKQLEELANFTDTLNIPYEEPILLGGDFNINEFGKDIDTLLTTLHVNLVENVGYRYSSDGTVNTMATNTHQSRIDFVFYHNLHVQPKMALNKVFIIRALDTEKMWPQFDLSDHFPTASYFDFSELEH